MPKKPKKKKRLSMYRSARTGKAVSKRYAEQHPDKTVRETR